MDGVGYMYDHYINTWDLLQCLEILAADPTWITCSVWFPSVVIGRGIFKKSCRMMQLFGRCILMSVFLLVREGMPGPEYNEIVRKVFDDEEQGYKFYNNYAKEKGFSVRKDYCEWDIGHNERTLRHFVCSCQGFRKEKEPSPSPCWWGCYWILLPFFVHFRPRSPLLSFRCSNTVGCVPREQWF